MEKTLEPGIFFEADELESYPKLLKTLLKKRGIRSKEEAETFLNPSYEKGVHDPFLLKDMDKASERILRAVKNNEKVVVWSDYDADGVPGGVIFHDFFKKIGFSNFSNFIPDRHLDGFGLQGEKIEEFAKENVSLLITIDCGIANIEEVLLAQNLGIDVIITDHHVPGASLPSAYAILNPKQSDCLYPEKMLCGAGVAFKLIQGILKKERFGLASGMEKWLLDMVGIATLSDMVPLLGENRIFAHYGLTVLRKSKRRGLLKLFDSLRLRQRDLSTDDVGFSITPRINAASRMGVSRDAFRLFATEDAAEAESLVSELNALNDERKGIVASMVKEMKGRLKEMGEEKKIIVLGNPSWRPSLLGLAANTLSEEYGCPVFLWGRDGGNLLKGSCRSKGASVLKLMERAPSGTFKEFGGHALSGGFEVDHEKIHILSSALLSALESSTDIEAEKINQEDAQLGLDDVNFDTWRMLDSMEPYGIGNPKPVFLFKDIEIDKVESFGKEKNHLKLIFRKSGGSTINAIKFFSKPDDYGDSLGSSKRVDLLASIERSLFRNMAEIRLRIIDIV